MENTNYSNAKYLVKFILWLKSIYDQVPDETKPYVKQLADATRQRLVDEGIIEDPDNDPIVGKNTSYEKGIQNLGLTADTDVTPEQKALQALQSMGIDTSPLKLIMPSLFTPNKQTTQTKQATLPEQQTTPQTTQQGVSVPTYGKTPTGNITQTGQLNQSSVQTPAGTVPIRNYLKDVYGLSDDAFQWDDTRGLTLKIGDKGIYLGKPEEQEAIQTFKGNAIRRPDTNDKGQIINGSWYINPSYIDTVMSVNGLKRQKEPIREALPKYLESKGIVGATVDWDKNTNQVLVKIGDKTYKLGTPSQIGSVYNGTTYVSQADLDRVLPPVLKELGMDIANRDFNNKPNDTNTTGDTGTDTTGTTGTDTTGTTGTTGTDNTNNTPKVKDTTLEDATIPQLKLNEDINKANITKKTYDQLITDIESGENTLLNTIHDTYTQLITNSLATMDAALKEARKALEGTKGNYDEYEKTAYEEIDKNVEAAKSKSKEEMAARGVYFSGLTTRALNNIEAQGVSEKNKVHMQVLQYKAQIDSQIAIMTANTKMSEAQLENELMAREALDKLQLIEKDNDKIEAIKQEKALLDAQIEVDKLNLPLENELYRRQQEIQDKQDAMTFMEKVYFPMLRLQYEDKWKEESLDLAYMKYQQSVMSFFEDVKEFWAKLGFDEDKFKQTFLWDKEKFAAEMGFKQEELETKSEKGTQSGTGAATGTKTEIPTWLQRYLPYLKMQPDKLDAMVEQGYIIDINGEQRKLTDEDKNKISVLAGFLRSLEPENKNNFLTNFNKLTDTFGDEGALQILGYIDTDYPEAKVLKQIGVDYGSFKNFADNFGALISTASDKEVSNALSKYYDTLKKATGADQYVIASVITYLLNKYGYNFGSRGTGGK